MKKDVKNVLLILGLIILLSNPILLLLGIIIYAIYLSNNKNKFKANLSKAKEKYKNSDKTSNYEVIDTTAEVIDSKILQENEWTATKEYKR